jgi:signal transduction histidine kinase
VNTHDLFISYNWQDAETVERLAQGLRDHGLNPFLDRWYLIPGLSWPDRLERLINECHAVAVCLGPCGLGRWQQREMYLALARQTREPGFPVIPVLLPSAEPSLTFLTLNTWVDMRKGVGEPLQLEILAKAVHGEPPSPSLVETIVARICPYRGLRPFREEDAGFFFGRDSFVGSLVKAIGQHQLVAVIGPSGSGKSSVVSAGLLPRLRRIDPNSCIWEIVEFRPGDRPLQSLSASLLPLLEQEISEVDRLMEMGKLAKALAEQAIRLRDVVESILAKQEGTDRLLLFVDQLEELYTLCSDETTRRRFLAELMDAAVHGRVTVVFALRGDFYGHALKFRSFADMLQGSVLNLGPMLRDELRMAVAEPAHRIGADFEKDLVERILDDVGEESGNLPLLEFALTELWARRQGGLLTHKAYRAIGGIRGAIVQRAETVFGSLKEPEQDLARRIFVQLVRPGEGTEDTRRRARLDELLSYFPTPSEQGRKVIKHMADARLVVTGLEESTNEETVEIVHEALIRGWDRLRGWMKEDRVYRVWQERFRVALRQWEESGRDEGALLRGVPLQEAGTWMNQRPESLSDLEKLFIQTSHEHAEEEKELIFRQKIAREERLRWESELHEAMNVLATGVTWEITAMQEALMQNNSEEVLYSLQRMEAAARRAYDDLKYILNDLRDPVLERKGLFYALKNYASAIGQGKVVVEGSEIGNVPIKIQHTLYRIAQEAISNALKYARIRERNDGRILVEVAANDDIVTLTVTDNGTGFDTSIIQKRGSTSTFSRMRDLAMALGIVLSIESSVGKGTEVSAQVRIETAREK